MKVLSLFDGMACGALALQAAGIEIESYDAFEIDKYAIKTAMHNFPYIKHHGDVFMADFTQFKGADLLCGGSPCTYWSIAQKNNRETVASGMGWDLFCQYVRALHEAQPLYFVYENNKSMSNAICESITQTFGFEPICINSALVSAQNRQRLYWVGRRNADGTYTKVNVDQPEDKGILLKDILESGCCWQDKSFAYTTRCNAAIPEDTLSRHRHTMVAEPIDYKVREGSTIQVTENNIHGLRKNGATEAESFVYFPNGKTNALLTGHKPMCVDRIKDQKPMTFINKVYEVKDGIITIKDKQFPIKLADGFYIIRKLTVTECKRLQTVPEWYVFPVSNTQAYKMLGNGWTVDVIAHILTYLKD